MPDELPARLRSSPTLIAEVDAISGGDVCSASLKGVVKEGGVKAAVAGEQPLRKLFSKEQRAFYAEHAPAGTAIDDLAILGPIFVLKLKSPAIDLRQAADQDPRGAGLLLQAASRGVSVTARAAPRAGAERRA